MRSTIVDMLDTKFGPVVFALSERSVVLFEPYLDKDGKPTISYSNEKKSNIVVRGIPYTFHVEIKIKDGVWEAYTNGRIYRADDKNKDPSDAATTAIKNELLAVWLKYISQHPEFLLEVKIGSLENQVQSLLEKNESLAKTIASNEQEINNKGKEISDALASARAQFPNF